LRRAAAQDGQEEGHMKHATALDLHAQADLLARLGLHARVKREDRGRMRRMIAVLLNAIPAPLLVLDGELRILAVSQAFCRVFDIRRQDILGRPLGEPDSGRWDIPALKARLQGIRPLGNDRKRSRSRSSFLVSGCARCVLARRV